MLPNETALLVNLVGHAAGTLIFSIFLAMFLRDRAGSRLRGSKLTVAAATLALVWNAGSLVALLVARQDAEGSILAAISFSALSLLPAVLLHISVGRTLFALRAAAYTLSAASVVLHLIEHFIQGETLHRVGLFVITIGFGIVTLISAGIAAFHGGTTQGSRLLGSMSLALFAMSFAHFGSHDGYAWSNELFFHHAGLPLALFVLLQDLRFLLVDAFLRFLASALLAGLVATVATRFPPPVTDNAALQHSLTIGLFCAAMLIFAALNGWLQQWLTSRVFRRPDTDAAAQLLRVEGPDEEGKYLNWAVAQLQSFLKSERVEAVDSLDDCGNTSPHPATDHANHHHADWVEAMVPINGPPGCKRLLLFGRRHGGLRYLSEDYVFLGQLAGVISERLNGFRTREMRKLVSEAELKALQSQINPHFLFNALNTIYGSIPRESPEARKMIRNLSDIFRYSLQAGSNTVPLEKELEIVRAYLEIEQMRFPDRLQVELVMAPEARHCRIPALTVQPLVENAIKHAIAVNPSGGRLRIEARIDERNGGVWIEVADTGKGGTAAAAPGTEIGLANVRRRLELFFGSDAVMESSFDAAGSMVRMHIPA
jgi:two-component system LytT family sensor kinase